MNTSSGGGSERSRWLRRATWITVAVIAAALGLSLMLSRDEERQAIDSMAEDERGELFHRAFEYFAATCKDPHGAFAEHCRHEAEFVAKFPECDEICWTIIEPYHSHPTR